MKLTKNKKKTENRQTSKNTIEESKAVGKKIQNLKKTNKKKLYVCSRQTTESEPQ